jgi:hypothetical protein
MAAIASLTSADAEQRIRAGFARPDIELVRRLAGVVALFGSRLSADFRRDAAAALRAIPDQPEIPAQGQAIKLVRRMFDGLVDEAVPAGSDTGQTQSG